MNKVHEILIFLESTRAPYPQFHLSVDWVPTLGGQGKISSGQFGGGGREEERKSFPVNSFRDCGLT